MLGPEFRWNHRAFTKLQPKLGSWSDIASACGVSDTAVRNWADETKPNGPDTPRFLRLCLLAEAKLHRTRDEMVRDLYVK